jgi:epoxyqueuosine reductase
LRRREKSEDIARSIDIVSMKQKVMIKDLKQQLLDAGFKSIAISTARLSELHGDYARLLEEGKLDKDFYDEIVSRYGLHWDFELPGRLPTARSIIIAAAQQPKMSLEFCQNEEKYYGIIPPTYVYDTDRTIMDIISTFMDKHEYKVCDALLPVKLLAVRSGLARYGRNNIAYISGWGSYFRLKAYFSDMPCADESWQEPIAMDLCNKCTSCVKKCPTSAINEERFLIDAGKCLTFLNEGGEDFPKWIDPAWHNCLIGCMICQDICPANKEHVSWIMPGGDFSEEETTMILDGVTKDKLPGETREKLYRVKMLDDYELLKRNLRVLIDKQSGGRVQ